MTAPAQNLNRLAVRLAEARIEAAVERRQRNGFQINAGACSRQLLFCLEAYATALTAQHLPIPPTLRDELRLRRRL